MLLLQVYGLNSQVSQETESNADGSGDFNEEIIFRGVGRVKGDVGFLHPDTSSSERLLLPLGPKEQRAEIAFIPAVQGELDHRGGAH